ncbi:MAG: hypothetical protein RJA25_610 [Bacteroidota bacterium]|jgi:pimeloyl-ACP methyl ester carboxylesterase
MKNIYPFLFACVLFLSNTLSAQTITTTVIKPPAQLHCNEVPAKLNNVVFGAIPPNSQNQPVVVFIHGWFDNGFSWFMAKNKWYENSYNAGYKTAFFFHSFSDAFEDNGRVIAQMIRETCKHYNTDKVIAVCHSKGGYDIDYALYNENMWDSVQGVITMSTPFWGAPIADLISVPFFRTILEALPIVGPIFQGKGTYQMQTPYMAGVVRPMLDNHPNNHPEKYHCFAAWGYQHATQFPNDAIPDDILKVVFKDYQPLCLDIPGFGPLAGNLMTLFMGVTGLLTEITNVQPKYENPAKNHKLNDGLAPYYSSLRPGSVEISQRPPSQQSYINHIDELLSSYSWNIVQPEIEYFKSNPTFRKNNLYKTPIENKVNNPIETAISSSDVQFIQGNKIEINTNTPNKLYVLGAYNKETIKVLDKHNKLIQTIPLSISTQGMFDIFREIDLSKLPNGNDYVLQTSVPITGLLKDGNPASIELNTHADKILYINEPLSFEVTLNQWNSDEANTKISGYLNRNMDGQGNVLHEKMIPISFEYDKEKNTFVCNDKLELEEGVYNVSVFAEGNNLKRFATSSILLKQNNQENKSNSFSFDIYPNPTSDVVNIKVDNVYNEKIKIELFDMLGKKITEQFIKAGETIQQIQLPIEALNVSKGAYMITVSLGNKKESKLLMKN